MIGRLNHVGVATPSIEASVKMYREVLGVSDIGERFSLDQTDEAYRRLARGEIAGRAIIQM